MSRVKNFLTKYWHYLAVFLLAVVFFLGTAGFNYYTQPDGLIKWLSPDEAANYDFSKLYAQEGRLTFFEKYNLLAHDVIHPRSFRSDYGWIKPMSFLGMILIYGQIAAVTGYKVLPYLTPFFAAMGIIFFYLLIREVFGKRNALISALLLASFPPYIYYGARSMFHNELFIVLLIISLYFAVLSVNPHTKNGEGVKKIKWQWADLFAGLAGAFFGLAAMTRTSELIWLLPVWLIIWLFNIKKAGIYKPIIFLAAFFVSITPMLYWNEILYGSYWLGGYNDMNRSIVSMAGAGADLIKSGAVKNNLVQIKDNFFFFGLHPLEALKVFYYYFVQMFYWIFWPAVLGFMILLAKINRWKKRHFAYFLSLATAAAILIFYYGSWNFHDNPDPRSHTIGNSYVRYWLPIYLGALPLVSVFLVKLSNLLRKKFLVIGFRILVIVAISAVSLKFVLNGSDEGLVKTAANRLAAKAEYDKVLELTEDNAIIVTRYHDKLLFPERKVILGLFDDDAMNAEYAVLAKYLPVYYYNFTFPDKDINYLNGSKLAVFGLRIVPIEKITKNFTLYRLSFK